MWYNEQMASLNKAKSRDRKHAKRNKMRVSGRKVFLWQRLLIERAKKARKGKK